jgi:hypothetical protein
MEEIVDIARCRAEHQEWQAVAAEVRQAIARSNLSREEFPSRAGTWLSTYAAGKVALSATLVLRMRRLGASTLGVTYQSTSSVSGAL